VDRKQIEDKISELIREPMLTFFTVNYNPLIYIKRKRLYSSTGLRKYNRIHISVLEDILISLEKETNRIKEVKNN